MAPTLVVKDGRVFLVVGSPGGSRIITAVLEESGRLPGAIAFASPWTSP